jgi:hypothetical protein
MIALTIEIPANHLRSLRAFHVQIRFVTSDEPIAIIPKAMPRVQLPSIRRLTLAAASAATSADRC